MFEPSIQTHLEPPLNSESHIANSTCSTNLLHNFLEILWEIFFLHPKPEASFVAHSHTFFGSLDFFGDFQSVSPTAPKAKTLEIRLTVFDGRFPPFRLNIDVPIYGIYINMYKVYTYTYTVYTYKKKYVYIYIHTYSYYGIYCFIVLAFLSMNFWKIATLTPKKKRSSRTPTLASDRFNSQGLKDSWMALLLMVQKSGDHHLGWC